VNDESLFSTWLLHYGADRFLLGADVKEEKIAINGWQETTDVWVYDFIKKYMDKNLKQIFCTDVSKDGLLEGVALELYRNILKKFPDLQLIASGGVRSMDDIAELEKIGCGGVIIGKAIYEGRIGLEDLRNKIKQLK
jgi:phosphoribosylformimino-5-aminoimidazole carboxamide ribotide isomerase